MRTRLLWPAVVLALFGCASDPTTPMMGDDDFPLSDVSPIYEDAPADRGMSLPFDSKADETLPPQFDLMDFQSPVRSQGRRGTCSIFATTALMESLYISEGTLTDPDFSEQFLQWSVKFEVNSFPNTSGSSSNYNLQAINRHGIVEEDLWPYEAAQWGASDDAACTGEDDQPTRCYTNGEPPAEALAAERFNLPQGRWINPSARSLRGHLVSTRTPVVIGGDFFYQAWNHGRSNLTTNSEYSAAGYVLSPNQADIDDSSGERRAGHAVLVTGYDEDLEVPRVDGEGNEILDENGEPVMERGFFLFKNSWGTGRFGTTNPFGDGYGWISFRYVEEHMTAYRAGLPTVTLTEICNDGRDNDRNGAADCADAACAMDRACQDPGDSNENTTQVAIPDNDPMGVSTAITVADGGSISSLAVSVDVTHSYRGDLTLRLVRDEDGAEATLIDQDGGSADDIQETFTVADFNGSDAAGTYRLVVVDSANADTGTLNSWSIDITRCESDCGGTAMTRDYADTEGAAIPDDGEVSRTLTVDAPGEITEMSVTVDIDHTFPYELTIRIAQEGGRELVLLTEDNGDDGVSRTFTVPGFVGTTAAADYTLTVVDGAAGDTGTINSWSIQVATR
ncbi:MAG: proprotein convertase P-domain-containing protein [Sandaracinaceae bacterium]